MNMPLNIDWQQILLHLLNFVILAGGLYFILYKPVKSFMEKREAHYKEIDEEANKKLLDANKLNEEYAQKLKSAEADIRMSKSKAAEENAKASQASLEEAKKKTDKIISDAEQKAKELKERYIEDAKKEVDLLAEEAAEKIVMDSEKSVLDKFLDIAEAGDNFEGK